MRRVRWAVASLAALWPLRDHPAAATVLVPMSDEALVPFARFAKARAAAAKASRVTTAKKQRKQLGKALAFLDKTDRAITKNIQGECAVGMKALVADLRARATAAREGIQ